MSWHLLLNSLVVAGGTTLLATTLGFGAALGCLALGSRLRLVALGLGMTAFMLPPFLVTNAWLDLFGQNGAWQTWFPLKIYSLGGAIALLSLLLWPLSFVLALVSWRSLDQSQLEADTALGGSSLLRWLLGPLAWPYLKLAMALVFVLALNNFTVPAILQVKVLPATLWVDFNTTFEYGTALAQGWPLVLIPVLLLVLLFPRRPLNPWPAPHDPVPTSTWRNRLGPSWMAAGIVCLAITIVLSVGLPLGQLVSSPQTWTEIPVVLKSSPGPLWNSFFMATLTALACLITGFCGRRTKGLHFLWLPFLVPGILLGILLIHLFNRPGFNLVYPSACLVAFSWVLRYQAFAWQGLRMAEERSDPDLRDAALLNGARGLQLWRLVDWPNLAPFAGVTAYLIYLFCLWDVETLVLLVPPGGETLALRVFNLLHYGHNAQVNAMCLLLLGLALLPLVLWKAAAWLQARTIRFVPS